jgi:dipeptidyl aminopeptidase/acylaminoacyl peptidase
MRASVSNNGILIYQRPYELVGDLPIWQDRRGVASFKAPDQVGFLNPTLSRDGRQLAFAADDGSTVHLRVMDLQAGSSSRLTFESVDDVFPVWSPDGQRLAYAGTQMGQPMYVVEIRRVVWWKVARIATPVDHLAECVCAPQATRRTRGSRLVSASRA